ncbi:hypothetical protein LzC2_06740 [Planctomycetes bacterium LzC2]|uniref:Uncharacterized protein n=1 Tax=Alienimonas chondri TaxID=2681879 RepID=A0ABX1VC30_9PLAN|nr:hypothetical protein [Alienimonas chondri]
MPRKHGIDQYAWQHQCEEADAAAGDEPEKQSDPLRLPRVDIGTFRPSFYQCLCGDPDERGNED